MEFHVYFLKSCSKNKFYIGCTSNIKRRLDEHNSKKTKSTRHFIPWKIIYYESFSNKSEAYKREWHLKHPKGYLEKRKIIEKCGG